MKVKLIAAMISATLLSMNVHAQTTTSTTTSGTTTTSTATTVPADKLVKQYTSLAGSEANATKLVTGLRDGSKEIQLTSTSTDGKTTTTTTTNPMAGKTMGYGNVNIVLAMAERQLSGMTSPTSSDLNRALTNPDNGILTLRASGMGWGQIANKLGFKVGDVMKASAAQDAADKKAVRPDQKSAKESKASEGRPEAKNGRQDKIDRPQKTERPEKVERPEKTERPEKVERPEASQRPEKGGR